jgi:hypothetical protein
MDELKLYNSLTDTVKIFNNDVKMIFGFDKCTVTNIRKGEDENQQRKYKGMDKLWPEEIHKYLGIPQNQEVDHSHLQKIFTKKYRKSHKNFEYQVICEKSDHSTENMGTSCSNLFVWNNQVD